MFLEIGELYYAALKSFGFSPTLITETVRSVCRADSDAGRSVYRADSDAVRSRTRTDSQYACWAGLGWGEITLGGSKVLGLSQRRNRWGARIQTMFCFTGSAAKVLDYIEDAQHVEIATGHVTELRTKNLKRADLEECVLDLAKTRFG